MNLYSGLGHALALASSAEIERERLLQQSFGAGATLWWSSAHRAILPPAQREQGKGPGRDDPDPQSMGTSCCVPDVSSTRFHA